MTFDGQLSATIPPPLIRIEELLERYDAFLVDAYGVLVDSTRVYPTAARFLHRLRDANKRFLILSNDASKLPSTAAERYQRFGLPIDECDLLTSGTLVGPYLLANDLAARPSIVLGPHETRHFILNVGSTITRIDDPDAEVVVVFDDGGFPFLPAIEAVLSNLIKRIDRNLPVHLVLPNPDYVYPKAPGQMGLAAGSVASLIEQALQHRFGDAAPQFVRLGKPHLPIFTAGMEQLAVADPRRVVMIGDQLQTDILGAQEAGIDSVLVGTGVSALVRNFGGNPRPTWVIDAVS